jgi:hypothetical protein
MVDKPGHTFECEGGLVHVTPEGWNGDHYIYCFAYKQYLSNRYPCRCPDCPDCDSKQTDMIEGYSHCVSCVGCYNPGCGRPGCRHYWPGEY